MNDNHDECKHLIINDTKAIYCTNKFNEQSMYGKLTLRNRHQ
jgi:hypothetical protein